MMNMKETLNKASCLQSELLKISKTLNGREPETVNVHLGSFFTSHFGFDIRSLDDHREVLRCLMHGLYAEYCDLSSKAKKSSKKMKGRPAQLNIRPFILTCLSKVFEILPFRPEYEAHMEKSCDVLAENLASDPEIQKAINKWNLYKDPKKEEVIHYVALKFNRTFSTDDFMFKPPRVIKINKKASSCSGGHFAGQITIYKAYDYGKFWNDFKRVLGTTLHEVQHDHQEQIAKRIVGAKKADHPVFYGQCLDFQSYQWPNAILSENNLPNQQKIYFTVEKAERLGNFDLYYNQPVERDARKAGNVAKLTFAKYCLM